MKKPKSNETTNEDLRLYNASQLFLIQYMLRKGIIETVQEYSERFAPVFELLSEGVLEVDTREWDEIVKDCKNQIKSLTK